MSTRAVSRARRPSQAPSASDSDSSTASLQPRRSASSRITYSYSEGKSHHHHHHDDERSDGHRRSAIRRGAHKIHKRSKALKDKLKSKKHDGKDVKLPAWTVALIALVLLAAIAGLAYYAYSHDWYADVKDFVTFPELKTPLDPESIFNEATKAVVSVATQIATGAVSVGTQIATGAVEAANDVKDGAEDAANKVKDIFGGIGKRDGALVHGGELVDFGALFPSPTPRPLVGREHRHGVEGRSTMVPSRPLFVTLAPTQR